MRIAQKNLAIVSVWLKKHRLSYRDPTTGRLGLSQVELAELSGVSNVTIHLAEKLAGRKQFIRWGLTRRGVVECPNFPGCSQGFEAIAPHLSEAARCVQLGGGKLQAVALRELVQTARRMIEEDPLALLCERGDCECCRAIREPAGM